MVKILWVCGLDESDVFTEFWKATNMFPESPLYDPVLNELNAVRDY
jgi:hypothetical protein